MTTTIQKWGNSQGIRIPKFLIEAVEWHENEQLVMSAENDSIVIRKAEPRKNIIELFEGYDGDYKPTEIDWGEPVGNEVW